MSAGNRNVSILALLDVTAAFDTVDHKIPLDRLENWFGPEGTALNWFNTYSASLAKDISLASATMSLEHTFSFVLYYSACICKIIGNHGEDYHCYADDTVLFVCSAR